MYVYIHASTMYSILILFIALFQTTSVDLCVKAVAIPNTDVTVVSIMPVVNACTCDQCSSVPFDDVYKLNSL